MFERGRGDENQMSSGRILGWYCNDGCIVVVGRGQVGWSGEWIRSRFSFLCKFLVRDLVVSLSVVIPVIVFLVRFFPLSYHSRLYLRES